MKTERERRLEGDLTVTQALTYLGYLLNSALCGGYEPHQNLYKYHQAVRSILVKIQEALADEDAGGEDKGRDDWMGPTRMPEAQRVNTTTADKLKEDTRAIAQSREGWDHGQCPTCERPLETRTLILCPDCDVRITPSKAAAPEPGPEKNDEKQ